MFLLAAVAATGCTVDADGDLISDEEYIAAAAITPNRLLQNDEVIGVGGVTRADVQALLEYHGSALASYREGGASAARMIHDAARGSNLSPIYLLARIETESGLVRSGTLRNISAATGCGCPDGADCDPQHAGFGLQVQCAAEKIRGYLRSLDTSGQTISGWKVGRGKSTLDPCWVVPANKVTAALYTYTPWVGAYAGSCGTSRWGGSSLVALLTRRFGADYQALGDGDPDPDPDPTPAAVIVDSDPAENDPAVAEVEMSANWIHSSATPGYFGTDYAYASVKAVSDAAIFWFYLDRAETRAVDARWTAGGNRSASAPFIVEDAAGNRLGVVRADQTTDGNQWNQLGRFAFSAGWNRVMLSRWTADGTVVVADAIRVR